MLVTDISQSRHVRPVSCDRVFKLLHQLGIAEQTRFDEAAIESISRMAPAQLVLYGQFVESGGKLRLDMTLRKAGSGVPLPLKVEAASSNVFALVDEITGRIKKQLDLTPDQLKGDNDRPIAEVSTASLEALRAYQAGLAKFQRGANQAAIPLLKEATIKDPNFAMAYARLAEAHRNIGESHEAEAAIDRAQRLSEKAALPLTERYQIHATAALVKDDFETAAGSYGEMAKLYPEDPDIQLNLAGSLEKLGKLPEAIESYKRVMKIAPGYGAALLGLGRVQVMSGHHNEAISSLLEALATGQHRDDLEGMGMIHSILGIAYREIGNLEKAKEHLNLSLDFRTKAADKRGQAATLSTLATVYALMGQSEKALDAHTRALTIAREMGDRDRESNYLVEIGITHKTAGDLDRALAAFRQSLQIEMGRQDYTHLSNRMDHIADIYRLKGQYDDALVYLEQAKTYLAKSGEKTETANNFTYIGLVWKAQGHYKEALEALRAALALFHEMGQQLAVGEVHQYLAEIYINQGRYADSYKSLQQSLDIYTKLQVDHGIPEVKTALARLLIIFGLPDAAERELGEAGHHAGGGQSEGLAPGILLGRAELARLRGKYELASKAYQQAAIQANRNGQKDASLESRINLANLYLEQGKLGNAERLLLSTRQEALQSRLRSLESEAVAGLAAVYLAKGEAEPARKAALEAISIAENFSGRPTLQRAYASLGGALVRLNHPSEAMDAYSKAASTLDWIRGSLLPQHVDSFMRRAEIVTFLRKTVAALEKGGRTAEALSLKKWIMPAQPSQGEAVARGPR
jgi:tetratricopeptide (TPR) repeat protein